MPAATAKKVAPAKKAPAKKPTQDFAVGQKLMPKSETPTIVGKTVKGEWIVESQEDWGGTSLNTYTTAQLDREFKILS